jgi:intracellular septation protein A
MNSSTLWFGFLPVMAFLIMDAVSSQRVALWGAMLLGAVEAGYTLAVFGALDYLSLLAFAVLAASVAVSLRNRDDFYFKIQGALVNLLLAVAMLITFYIFHRAMLLDAARKYLDLDKLVAANPQLQKAVVEETFRLLSYQLPWWLVLHSLWTVYAAANWGKWAWAFVRVPGFILIMTLAFAFAQVAAMRAP